MRSSRPAVKNVTERSAAIWSGGSFSSWSVTAAACTVAVQLSLRTKSSAGSSVNVVPSPLTVTAWSPLLVQASVNAPSAAFTGSENVISTSASSATSRSPAAGLVELTLGAVSASQKTRGRAEPRGVGRARGEVGGVVVGVLAAVDGALVGGRVGGGGRRAGALEEVRVAVADEVDDAGQRVGAARRRAAVAAERGRAAHQRDLARARGHRDRRRVDQVGARDRAGALLDEEVVAGRHVHRGQLGQLPAVGPQVPRAGRARVLQRHARQRGARGPAVEDLDEVRCERRAGVASAAVDLAHDQIR